MKVTLVVSDTGDSNAVSWVHQLSGLESIAQSPFVQATVAGLKRSLAKPKA